MKKAALSTLALVLSVVMVATGLAWDQKGVMKTAPAVRSKDPTDRKIVLPPPSYKVVFITSQGYTGNLGGLQGANAKCQDLATKAGMLGTFKAWLARSPLGSVKENPITTFTKYNGVYRLRNGVVIANNWNELITTGKLLHQINVDEKGNVVNYALVWTGFQYSPRSDGSIFWNQSPSVYDNCLNWTNNSPAGSGGVGEVWITIAIGDLGRRWTYKLNNSCYSYCRLYCFQQ